MNTFNHHETISETSHHGKIGRLPREVRERLNLRLDDGETAETILPWLNELPKVKKMLAAAFGGNAISAQNLSNWRQGGFQQWRKQQERRLLMQDWVAEADELVKETGDGDLANRLSAVLLAELALAVQEELPTLTDPAERCAKITEYLLTLTRVRQQEHLAGRLAIDRERREREREEEIAQDEQALDWNKTMAAFMPGINPMAEDDDDDDFDEENLYEEDEEECEPAKKPGSNLLALVAKMKLPGLSPTPAGDAPTESNQIKVDQTKAGEETSGGAQN